MQNRKKTLNKNDSVAKKELISLRVALALSVAAILSPIFAGSSIAETSQTTSDAFTFALTKNSPDEAVLTLKLKAGSVKSVFTMSTPSRLVIDLDGVSETHQSAVHAAATMLVTAVRFGAHPDSVRIVVDCNGKTPPTFERSGDGNDLVVTLKSTDGAAAVPPLKEAAKPTPTPKPANTPTNLPTAVPTKAVTTAPTAAPTKTALPPQTATVTATLATKAKEEIAVAIPTSPPPHPSAIEFPNVEPVVPSVLPPALATPHSEAAVSQSSASQSSAHEMPTAVPSAFQLSSIRFDYTDPGHVPVLKLNLSQHSEFKITKADDRKYEIVLGGYTLARENLSLPMYPPDDFAGFTFVRAEQRDDALVVSIGVERTTRLAAIPHNDSIWIQLQ